MVKTSFWTPPAPQSMVYHFKATRIYDIIHLISTRAGRLSQPDAEVELPDVEVEFRYTKPNESGSRPPAEYAIRGICIDVCCCSLRLIDYLYTQVTSN